MSSWHLADKSAQILFAKSLPNHRVVGKLHLLACLFFCPALSELMDRLGKVKSPERGSSKSLNPYPDAREGQTPPGEEDGGDFCHIFHFFLLPYGNFLFFFFPWGWYLAGHGSGPALKGHQTNHDGDGFSEVFIRIMLPFRSSLDHNLSIYLSSSGWMRKNEKEKRGNYERIFLPYLPFSGTDFAGDNFGQFSFQTF